MDSDLIIKKDCFSRVRTEPFEEIYQIHPKVLGSGSFGKVYKVRERQYPTGTWRAAKMYIKKQLARTQVLNQLNILKKIDHPSIIKVYQVFDNENKLYVVQDYCEGGQLFEKINQTGGFSELQARRIFRQLVQGVNYCHSHHICHRDLKPQNILFVKKQSLELKIIDFGLAFEWQNSMSNELLQKNSKNVIGTAYYISPDILTNNNHYDQRADIWSLGVILYVLVTCTPPFDGNTQQQIFQRITKYKYSLNIKAYNILVPELKEVSPQLKDLIKKILVPPQQRITLQQILNHIWMTSQPNKMPIKLNVSNLNNFSKFSKTKKLASQFIASQMPSIDVAQLTKMFHQIDINKDGEITFEQLKKGLQKQGMKYAQIKMLMDSMDVDRNGKINYTQFLAGFSGDAIFTEQNIKRAFRMLDLDGNGLVQKSQLLSLFKQSGMGNLKGKSIQSIVQECDRDGNGVIDYQQFRLCLLKKN